MFINSVNAENKSIYRDNLLFNKISSKLTFKDIWILYI